MMDLYAAVIPQAPYIIGAYGLIWIGLLGFVYMVFGRIGRLEKELRVLEESVERRTKS
ncbi:MAG: CcmD family protein [Actinobacteria bacterium]|nr:MAG: CcmD family protein [Actinomycetota bacterium]